MTDAQKKEFTYRISQASPVAMVTILYDVALVHLEEAEKRFENGDEKGFKRSLHLLQDTINELKDSLDLSYEPAPALLELYLYIRKEIAHCIAEKKTEYLRRPYNILAQLREAYVQLEKIADQGSVMVNSQQVYAGLTYGKGNLVETVDDSNRGFFA